MSESTIRSLFLGALPEAYEITVHLLEGSVNNSRGDLEQGLRARYNRQAGNAKSGYQALYAKHQHPRSTRGWKEHEEWQPHRSKELKAHIRRRKAAFARGEDMSRGIMGDWCMQLMESADIDAADTL